MTSATQARTVRWLTVLWPAFLVAIVLEALVFTAFDPLSVRWTDALGDPLSPLAVYSLGFLAIWALVAAGMALAKAFDGPPTTAA